MKKSFSKVVAAALLAASTIGSQASTTVLTFEGVGDLNPVGSYYDGVGGPDYNVVFSPNALAIVDADAGGTGNFGGEPSPDTILFFLEGGAAVLNHLDGFTTGFSFFYSAINQPGFVNVWSGLNATGTLLATLPLPVTPSLGGDPNGQFSPLFPVGVAFSGTAMSIDFGGTVNQIGFDNITFGSETPEGAVPEPSTVIGGLALGALALRRAIRRK